MTAARDIAVALLFSLGACASPGQATDPALQQRREAFAAKGLAAPITILPVQILGRPDSRVGQALGLVLERQGFADLEMAANSFTPAAAATWEQVIGAFGRSAAPAPGAAPAVRYQLYAQFLGTPRTGPDEVRFVVVDGSGAVVFADRQVRGDADFQRTAAKDPDPLGCATLVAERLFSLTELRRAPGAVKDGRFAKLWQELSGGVDRAEITAMNTRRVALKKARRTASFTVLPLLCDAAHDGEAATRFAASMQERLGGTWSGAPTGAKLVVVPDSNEQRRLWDLAKALRAAVQKQPGNGYTLAVDFGIDAGGAHGYVHLALVDAAGDLVLVDMVNDQSPLFRKLAPTDRAGAERLAQAALADLLR